MFRKQVNPKVAAVLTLVTLASIQWAYWRLLVHQPPGTPPGPMSGGAPPPPMQAALGLDGVQVDNWAGEEPGYADGPGWKARFAGPNALAEEADGSLLVADSRNHCVRRITPQGKVTTLAGGAAAGARFRYPSGIAVAKDGTVYIADTGNHRLCRLKAGQFEVVAGGAAGMADGAGSAARFNSPGPLAFDHAGGLWVSDFGNRKLRRVSVDGKATTPAAIPPEIAATLGMASRTTPEIISSADRGVGPITPSIFKTGARTGAAVLPSGARVFADLTHHVVYIQRPGEAPLLIAGRLVEENKTFGDREGTGLRSAFATPAAVLARADGTVFVADYDGNRIRRLRLPTELIQ